MNFAKLRELLRYLAFGISLGTVSVIAVNAAVFLGTYNALAVGTHPLTGVLLLLASLLATAPLIGWWYNFLHNLFRIDFTGNGGSQ